MNFTPPRTPKPQAAAPQARDILSSVKDHLASPSTEKLLSMLERIGAGNSVPGANAQIRAFIPAVEKLAAEQRSYAQHCEGSFDIVKLQSLKTRGASDMDAPVCHDFVQAHLAASALEKAGQKLSALANAQGLGSAFGRA